MSIHNLSTSSRLTLTRALAVSMFCASSNLASAQSFSGLGFPAGTTTSASRAVSADGSVVVGDAGPAFGGVGFRWTAVGGMQSVGTFAGGTYTFAPGVSGDGAVVTGYGDTASGQRAYRWTSATGLVSLGSPAGATQVLGSAANVDGSVIVGTRSAPTGYRAFRWTNASGIVSIGALPGGLLSFGYGVSADGNVVVGDSDSSIGDVAFRWTTTGGMQNLGTLPGGGFSFAYAVSADGLVVVGDSDSSSGDIAYRWTASTGMVSLGTLPGTFQYMVSNGVNANGSVIVGTSIGPDRAFLWTASLGIVDLNTYLPSLGINLAGWTLTDGGGVSADGQTIVGTGIHNGVDEAWIAHLQGPIGTPFCFGDGSGTACPCGNSSAVGAQAGCTNSLGLGAKLTVTGNASLLNDSVVLTGVDMPNSSALYFQGTTQQSAGLGAVFGDGLRCAGGSVIRLGTKSNVAGTSSYPIGADLPIAVKGLVGTPGTRTYQTWYRNSAAFCTASTFNLSSGIEIAWGP